MVDAGVGGADPEPGDDPGEQDAAQGAGDQASGGFISHNGFPGARVSAYRSEFGAGFDANAENVAMTGGSREPAKDFVDMWVGSLGHRRNMLGDFQVLGVGMARAPDGAWYATQIFGDE